MLDEIFKKIQDSQVTTKYVSNRNENLLKTEPGTKEGGNTFLVRLVPYMKNPVATLVSFHNHGFENKKGKYVTVPCLKTWNPREQCPICEVRFGELAIGTQAAKNKAKLLRQKTTNYVNVYVIKDPVNPENNGKVKILRYGAELEKIIKSATTGEDVAEFGKRIFDLSPDGVDFRIKVESKGVGKDAVITYAASKFISVKNDLGLTKEDIERIVGEAHDLSALVPAAKSDEELLKFLNENYFTDSDRPQNVTQYVSKEEESKIASLAEEYGSGDEDANYKNKSITATSETAGSTVDALLAEFQLPNA